MCVKALQPLEHCKTCFCELQALESHHTAFIWLTVCIYLILTENESQSIEAK